MIWTPNKSFNLDAFESEADLEASILKISKLLFGPERIYLDAKKLIGSKEKTQNIPDGYVIDLSSKKAPRLYLVENELAAHHPLKHIAVQILEFSLSFESSTYKIKSVLKDALTKRPEARAQCENYATTNGFENLDYLLERLVQGEKAFNALVIIDESDPELETVLYNRFRFPVEILTLQRFKAADGECAYEFEPFLADISSSNLGLEKPAANREPIDPAEIDTIVVPAQHEGFLETFLGENRWHHIRIHASMIPRIKFVATYQVSPISAITHYAPVKDIQIWEDSGKYVLNFAEPPKEISPIKLVPKGTVKAPQGPRYTSLKRLLAASNLDEVF